MGDEDKTRQAVISLRLSRALVVEIETTRAAMEKDPVRAPRGRLSQADVIRSALVIGLRALAPDAPGEVG